MSDSPLIPAFRADRLAFGGAFRRVAVVAPLLAGCLGLLPLVTAPCRAQNLRVEDLRDGARFTPGQANPPAAATRRVIRVRWDARPSGSFPSPFMTPTATSAPVSAGIVWDALKRTPTNGNFLWYFQPGSANAGATAYDDSDWDYNTTYNYSLVGTAFAWYSVHQGNGVYQWQLGSAAWESALTPVTVRRIAATAAQTVDTRIDPRHSTYVLKDFKFRDDKYRGGLFAGYNSDGAKVARTYLKFTGLAGPPVAGQQLWTVGGLSLYLTRTAQANQPASVRPRFVADDTWTPATLVWSNAPAFKASGAEAVSLSWAAGTPGRWVSLNILPDLERTLTQNGGDGTLSVALSAPGEANGGTSATFPLVASSGWAYFARPGYVQDGLTDIQPYLLYAFGGYGVDINSVGVTPNYNTSTMPPTLIPLSSNSSRQGTLYLASAAPAGGVTVTLSSNSPSVTVPASVFLAAGQGNVSFTVSSGTITASGTVTISATLGKTVTAPVQVAP